MKNFFSTLLFLLLISCEQSNIELPVTKGELNGPIGIDLLKGTNGYALFVVNSNYTLKYSTGSISVIYLDSDLTTYSFDYDKSQIIDNFGAQLLLDKNTSRIYTTNRGNDSVLVYDYTYDDSTNNIDISTHNISSDSDKPNFIGVGTNPYGITLYTPAGGNPLLLVSNITSSDVYLLDSVDLTTKSSILLETSTDGAFNKGYGANRIATLPNSSFALVDSIYYNTLFFIDLNEKALEGVIYLDSEFGESGSGSRGIAISSDNKAYVVSRYLQSILVIDLTKVTDDGQNLDVIENGVINSIPIGDKDSTDIEIYENYLYLANSNDSSISVIDLTLGEITETITVGQGPTEIKIEGDKGFVTNFLSNSISIIDLNSNEVVLTIENM